MVFFVQCPRGCDLNPPTLELSFENLLSEEREIEKKAKEEKEEEKRKRGAERRRGREQKERGRKGN
jgi:hypothetical protein